MKLLCTVLLVNRSAPKAKTKSANSTIALCKQPGANDFCIILFTARNKQGTKYNLKNNIEKIFARCANEGKSTIQFKQPPHDICIQANTIQLKCFLRLLKMAVENKVKDEDLTHYSSMSVTPVAKKDIPQKHLSITNKLNYPSQGFPKSLEMLRINYLKLCTVRPGILNLRSLKVLDMSNNLIKCIPEGLNKLPCLQELYISENLLGHSSPEEWAWMGGQLSHTLKVLDLSQNCLKYLPKQIGKLYSLQTLRVNHNELKTLPTGIRNLTTLKTLTAANNSISVLPGSLKTLRLRELDLSCNHFNPFSRPVNSDKLKPALPPFSLKECAAKKVLRSRIPYTPLDLPRTLIQYLDDAKYCVCGEACFENFLKHHEMFSLKHITVTLTMSSPEYVPIDSDYCSAKCYSLRPLVLFFRGREGLSV